MSSSYLASRTSSFALKSSSSRYLARSPKSVRCLRNFGSPSYVAPLTRSEHMPFDFSNKRDFTYKFIAYLGFGFALPWVAVGWIWYRPGGLRNPQV